MYLRNILLTILPLFWPKMPPIGLGYLQSFLLKNGIAADILDLNNKFYNLADTRLKKRWLISCNTLLEKNILSLIQQRYLREFKAAIVQILSYDAVGFSCFKSNFASTLGVARLLKKERKDIKIILGGPEITRRFLKRNGKLTQGINIFSDLAVIGEGEKPLCEYLKGERKEETVEFEQLEDLSALPFPVYRGVDLHAYPSKDAVPIQFSRGCIRKCSFCSERLLYRGFRARGAKSVIDEIKHHRERNNIRYFVFFDSLINADVSLLESLCDAIIHTFGRINWEAQIAIRNDMSETIFSKIRQSGCYNLFIGLESGARRTLERMRKGYTPEEAQRFFEKLNRAGLAFGVSMITGYPAETDADFQESLDFITRNKKIIPKIEQVNPFIYYDGTDADRTADYKTNKKSLERMKIFVDVIKRNHFKYTNAFLGNLIEKDAGI